VDGGEDGGDGGGDHEVAPIAGERWAAGLVDDGPCASHHEDPGEEELAEPDGPRARFSYHGYKAWKLRVEREIEGATRRHCVTVAFPPGATNTDRKPVRVAARIDDGWLRAIENTLGRLPWRHLQVVQRVVIDDRPSEHGVAPFDRRKKDDARDGRTIWLHERLFTEPNHWAHGNHGSYWSYHLEVDGKTLDDLPPDHPHFSPVLLHEIGHLIAYSVVNGSPASEAVPPCARICGDRPGGCKGYLQVKKEEGCVSAYCMPFKFETGTENWAEEYRFYFQSSLTRDLLAEAGPPCHEELQKLDEGVVAPWKRGLPDIARFERTRWRSCGDRACKRW
jgi:hypothetical protein